MGLQDRLSHWHDDHRRTPTWYWPESWISRYALLMTLFIIAWIATRGDIQHWLINTKSGLEKGEIWRLVSPLLLPGSFSWLGMAISCLCLYLMGRQIVEKLGPRREGQLLIVALLTTALGGVIQSLVFGASPCSGNWVFAALAVAFFWGHVGREEICIMLMMVLPVRLQGRFIAMIIVAVMLIDSWITPWYHLPGLLASALCFWWMRLVPGGQWQQWQAKQKFPAPKASPRPLNSYQQNFKLHDHPKQTQSEVDTFIRDQVDPILEKIARSGKDSLSADEKAILAKAKEMLGK